MAFYFSLLLPERGYPLLIGPYETWDECASVREWIDRLNFETDYCAQMPYPQFSQLLHVGYLP